MMAMIALTWAFLALPVSLGFALCAMGQIARRDVQRFEIDFGACALLVTAGLCATAITEGAWTIADGLFSGAVTGGVTALAHLRWPGRMGRGDIVLLASMGAVAGTTLVPLLMGLFLLFASLTAALYSWRRGKRLFRSMFPAALPGMAALAVVMLWRHVPLLLPDPDSLADLIAYPIINDDLHSIAGQTWRRE